MSGGVDTDAFFWNICYYNDHISGGWERNFFCNYIKNSWATPNTSLFSFLFWTVLHLCMWSLKRKCNEMEQHRMARNSWKGHYLLMAGVQCVVIRTCPFLGTFLALVSRNAEHLPPWGGWFSALLSSCFRVSGEKPHSLRVQHCNVLSLSKAMASCFVTQFLLIKIWQIQALLSDCSPQNNTFQ